MAELMGFFDFIGGKIEYETITAKFRRSSFKLQVADTLRKLSVGLSDHEKISKAQGMLLVFNRDGRHGIWMLNMKFNIDIIWLDWNRRVVYIVDDAEPCASIFSCKTYKPPKDARYVIELH